MNSHEVVYAEEYIYYDGQLRAPSKRYGYYDPGTDSTVCPFHNWNDANYVYDRMLAWTDGDEYDAMCLALLWAWWALDEDNTPIEDVWLRASEYVHDATFESFRWTVFDMTWEKDTHYGTLT